MLLLFQVAGDFVLAPGFREVLSDYYPKAKTDADKAKCLELLTSLNISDVIKESAQDLPADYYPYQQQSCLPTERHKRPKSAMASTPVGKYRKILMFLYWGTNICWCRKHPSLHRRWLDTVHAEVHIRDRYFTVKPTWKLNVWGQYISHMYNKIVLLAVCFSTRKDRSPVHLCAACPRLYTCQIRISAARIGPLPDTRNPYTTSYGRNYPEKKASEPFSVKWV